MTTTPLISRKMKCLIIDDEPLARQHIKDMAEQIDFLEIKNDEIMLKFQYGMSNPDYPALIKKKIFVLDLDASFTGILKHHEIESYIIKQHTVIQNQFEFSITEKLREKFELN